MLLAVPQKTQAAVTINAQCTSGAVTGSWLGTADGRQSFVPTLTGTLFKVRLHTATYGSGTNITVRIFSGAVGSGSLLTSMVYFKGASTNSWDDVFLPGPGITINSGSPYYIEIANGSQVDWIKTSVDVYSSGSAWRGGTNYTTNDYNFEVHMAVPTCGGVVPGGTQSGVIANVPSAPLALNGGGDPGFWTTNGTGTFADPRNPGTTYTPGCSEAGSTTTLTWTSSCGLVPYNQSMNVVPPGFTASSATVCAGQSATLNSAGAGSVSWSTGATTASINVTPGTTTVYTVTGMQGNGCSVIRTATVTVNPLPNVASSPASVCDGGSASLNMTPSGGTPGYTFGWFNVLSGGTALVTSANYTTPALSPAGTYTYYPEVTDANGCKNTPRPAVVVTVNSIPTINYSGGPITCPGGTANLAATGATTYIWNPGGLPGASQTLSAGTYTISGTTAGCVGTRTLTLTQPPALSVSPSGLTTICSGLPLNITLAGAGGTPPYTYTWVGNDNPSTTGESTVLQTTGLVNNTINSASSIPQVVTYTLTVIDNNSCTATQTVNVTINPKPIISSPNTNTICSGLTLNHNLSATVASTYSWLATDNGNITGESTSSTPGGVINNNLTSSVQIAQAVSYTVTPTSSLGCVGNTQIVTVTVNPSPVITSANGIGICSGSSNSYTMVSNPAGSSYSWIAADNPNVTGESLSAQTTPTINNTLTSMSAAPENVSYTITPTSSLGCAGAPFVFITSVNPMPTMTSTNSATICSGGSPGLTLTSTYSSTYQWSAANNPNTTGESTAAQSSGVIGDNIVSSTLVSEAVTYTVVPTAITGGCSGPAQTVTVTVNPVPTMTSSFGTSVCSGVALNFALTSDVTSTYTWIAANNPNTTGESLGMQSTGTINNTIISSSPTTPENVLYSITPTSTLGCAGSVHSFTATVNPTPAMTSPNTNFICSGGTLNHPLTSSIVSTFQWVANNHPNTTGESTTPQSSSLINDVITSSSSSFSYAVGYTVTPTSSLGCVGASQTLNMTVNPIPVMTSGSSATVCSGVAQSLVLSASASSNFSWIAADNPNTTGESLTPQSATSLNNTVTSSTSTGAELVSYTVTPTSTSSCIGIPQVVTITVNPAPVVTSSNSFSECSGVGLNIPFSSSVGSNYTWIAANNVNTTGESLGLQTSSAITNTIVSTSTVGENISYTVTPTSGSGCAGIPQTLSVIINPAPIMTSPNSGTTCSGVAMNIPLTSDITATYSWVGTDNGNTSGESTASQSFTSLNDVVASASSVPENISYTVTPTSGLGCVGATQNVNVTVNPAPLVTSMNVLTVCSGVGLNHTLTSNVSSTFNWVAGDHPNTLGEDILAQGSSVITNTITSSSTVSETVSYTITPTSMAGCTGIQQLLTVTVDPAPNMTSPNSSSICSGTNLSINLSSDIPATYNWVAADNPNTTGESTFAQSFALISDNITSSSSTTELVSYTVTPLSGAGCSGAPQIITVTVDPTPVMTSPASASVCSGAPVTFPFSSNVLSNYQWVAADNSNTTGESISSQSTASINDNISSSSAVAETVTYTVTPTSQAAGCPGTPQVVNITVQPEPVMTSPTATTICSGSAVNLNLSSNITATYSWVATDNANTSGESTTAQSGAVISDVITSPVAEIVSYTISPSSSLGCPGATKIVDVTVNAIPAAPTAPGMGICDASTASLTATAPGGTYDWFTLSSGGTSIFTGPTFVTPVLSANTTYYVESTILGCIGPRTAVTVTVSPNPSFSILAPSAVCDGQDLNLGITSLAGGSSFTYNWSGPGSFSSSLANPIRTAVLVSDGGTYTLDISNEFSCVTTHTVSVTVLISPTALITGPASICANEAATLSGTSSSANGDVISGYQWLQGPTPIAGANSTTYVATAAGSYYLEVTNSNGCKDTSVVASLIVNAIPVPVVGGPTAFCSGAGFSLNGAASGAGGSATFSSFEWLLGGSTVTGATTINETFSTGGNYQLVITNSNGCKDTSGIYAVTENFPPVNPAVNMGITGYCQGDSVLASITSPIAAHSYTWSVLPASISLSAPGATSTYVRGETAGSFTVSVTETDANGCTSTATSTNIQVNALPNVGVSASATNVCTGGSVTLSGTGANSYIWTGGISDGIAFVPGATLTYTVTGTDLNSCSNTATQLITVNTPPTVTAGATLTSICPGTSTTLTAGGTATTYVWSGGAGTGTSVSVSPAASITYTVTGTDGNSCFATATVAISLLPQPALPVATAGAPSACAGISVLLSSSAAIDNHWFNAASPAVVINTAASFSHTEATAGSYSYGLYVQAAGGCSSDTAYAAITFNACLSSLADEFLSLVANGTSSGNVMTNDGNPAGYTVNATPISGPLAGSFIISASGAFTYTPNSGYSGADMIVVQACDASTNCLNDTIFVVILPLTNNDFGTVSGLIPNSQLTGNVLTNDAGTNISGNAILLTNVSSGTLTFGPAGDFTYTPNVGYCGLDSFRYQVCDAFSLCNTAYCVIDVNCDITLQTHTGFSPNGDGKNDLWVIGNIDFIENSVSLYDRWGNEIWKGTNYDNTSVVWDGKNKSGEELPSGTYFYLIEVKDKTPIRGWVEITK